MPKQLVLQVRGTGQRLAINVDDDLVERARQIVRSLLERTATAPDLVKVDPTLGRQDIQTRITLFESALESQREEGKEIGTDDALAKIFEYYLILTFVEEGLSMGDGEATPNAEVVGARLVAEKALFEAVAASLVDIDKPPARWKELIDRAPSTPVPVQNHLRGVMTVSGSPESRVKQLTGFDSIAALSGFITHREMATGLSTCQVLLDTGCNQDCIHCFLGAKQPMPDLQRAQQLIARDLPAAGLTPLLYYSEPFVSTGDRGDDLRRYREILTIVAANQRRLLLTNAVGVDEGVADLLAELGPFRLYVSLLGNRAETHDRITASVGSFDRAIAGISHLAARRHQGVSLCVNMLVHHDNLGELDAMVDRCVSFGAQSIFLKTLRPGPCSAPSINELCLRSDEFLELVKELGRIRAQVRGRIHIELSGSMGLNFHCRGIYYMASNGSSYCPAGRTMIALHPTTGAIYPCMMLSGSDVFKIGHWDWDRRTPVIDPERNVLGRLTAEPELLKGACSPERCDYALICRGGCRAAAAALSGSAGKESLLAGHEQCLTHAVSTLAARP